MKRLNLIAELLAGAFIAFVILAFAMLVTFLASVGR